MVLPIYDFISGLSGDTPEKLNSFIEECLLLDEEGLIEIDNSTQETWLVEKEV